MEILSYWEVGRELVTETDTSFTVNGKLGNVLVRNRAKGK